MKREKGSILITSLIFMFVMSLMLMAFLDLTTTGLKQTTYSEQSKKAFYIADGGLTIAGSAVGSGMAISASSSASMRLEMTTTSAWRSRSSFRKVTRSPKRAPSGATTSTGNPGSTMAIGP